MYLNWAGVCFAWQNPPPVVPGGSAAASPCPAAGWKGRAVPPPCSAPAAECQGCQRGKRLTGEQTNQTSHSRTKPTPNPSREGQIMEWCHLGQPAFSHEWGFPSQLICLMFKYLLAPKLQVLGRWNFILAAQISVEAVVTWSLKWCWINTISTGNGTQI